MSFTFFEALFPGESDDGRDLGYVVLALYPVTESNPEGKFHPGSGPTQNHFFSWPSQKDDLIAFCLQNNERDIYTVPALLKNRGSREASNIAHQWCAYVDAGELDLRRLKAEPTMVVETSPDRHQLYWVSTTDDTRQLAEISRAITHAHQDDGCRDGTWDSGQLLRVPGTTNNKVASVTPHEVRLKGDPGRPYSGLTKLKELYPQQATPDPSGGVPDTRRWRNAPRVMEEVARIFSQAPDIHSLYMYKSAPDQRPEVLRKLLCMLSRHGASRLAAMHIAWGARCSRYPEGERSTDEVWALLCEVFDDPANLPVTTAMEVTERTRLEASKESPGNQLKDAVSAISILRDDERDRIPTDTIVDRYVAWASTRTDAPMVYHRAGAVILLTTLFGEFGKCPTRFDVNLTLWFLLLGPTTRARKTTAMMMAVDLIADLQTEKHEYAPLSDVTGEGLLIALSKRDGKTTFFYRDEAQGLLYEQEAKRYLKGFRELMTELFNGRVRIRVRASDPVDGEDQARTKTLRTNFVTFLCGTLDQVTEALTMEDYQSGHLTRFLVAESDPPEPTEEEMYVEQYEGDDDGEDYLRQDLMNDLARARNFWAENTQPGKPRRIPFHPNAWKRLQKAIWDLRQIAKTGSTAEVLEPTAQRMGISVMKCSVLLAMSEQKTMVEMPHVLKAMELAEEWLASTAKIAGRIMHSSWSARREEILNLVRSHTDGVTQREIYRRFSTKMQEKEIESAIAVLIKSELIKRVPDRGRIRYRAMQYT